MKADIPHGRCLGCVGRLSGNLGRRHYCATELKRAIGGKIAVRAPVVYERIDIRLGVRKDNPEMETRDETNGVDPLTVYYEKFLETLADFRLIIKKNWIDMGR